MTFYEAALRVLESAGRPLHIQEITQQSIAKNLLSHVGKAPDQTMLSRLAAMARRMRDRRVIVTAKDTFALAEWSVPEDPEALAITGLPEANPEETLDPIRPGERHPESRSENVRSAGRPDRRRKYEEEEEGRGPRRRLPPIPELAFEILSEAGKAMQPAEIAQLAKERELSGGELSREQILTALLDDNQRRIDTGRRPQFLFSKDTGELALDQPASPVEVAASEVQAAFADALGISLEAYRADQVKTAPGAEALEVFAASARKVLKEARRAAAREMKRRLAELDLAGFHKAIWKMMVALGYRELKVAKRSRDGLLLTGRKREGSADLRFAIRLLKANESVDRRLVQELRQDLGHYGAQVGLILGAGDVRGDARGEAQSLGALVMLWCGEALGDKFLEARSGVAVTEVPLFEIDETFFARVKLEADESRLRRQERARDRQTREVGRGAISPEGAPQPVPVTPSAAPGEDAIVGDPQLSNSAEEAAAGAGETSEMLDSEAPEDAPGALEMESEAAREDQKGEGPAISESGERSRRRRRRRRGRRGRGRSAQASPASVTPSEEPGSAGGEVPASPAPEREAGNGEAH
jgi:hypothetical protein